MHLYMEKHRKDIEYELYVHNYDGSNSVFE